MFYYWRVNKYSPVIIDYPSCGLRTWLSWDLTLLPPYSPLKFSCDVATASQTSPPGRSRDSSLLARAPHAQPPAEEQRSQRRGGSAAAGGGFSCNEARWLGALVVKEIHPTALDGYSLIMFNPFFVCFEWKLMLHQPAKKSKFLLDYQRFIMNTWSIWNSMVDWLRERHTNWYVWYWTMSEIPDLSK